MRIEYTLRVQVVRRISLTLRKKGLNMGMDDIDVNYWMTMVTREREMGEEGTGGVWQRR